MDKSPNLAEVLEQLIALGKHLPSSPAKFDVLPQAKRRELRREIEELIAKLGAAGESLDFTRQPRHVFDPTSPKIIGKLVADTLLLQDLVTLASVVGQPFYGAGVYAIYYRGAFPAYSPVSGLNYPIYIGKADPVEIHASTASAQGTRLHTRLKDHQRSISSTNNLEVTDFDCRFLVVRNAWIETAEDLLIERYKPVWNNETKVCYGFGKHGDNAGTRKNERSPWDTIHPGRPWATSEQNTPNKREAGQILNDIAAHFAKYPPASQV